MNIFNSLRVYAGKWNVSNEAKFSQEEMDSVSKAEVVDSQYGLSVCFYLKSGGQSYIPLDQNSSKSVGDTIDLSQASVLTLSKQGEADIYRVKC